MQGMRMAITREQLHELVDGLPEQEMAVAQRFLLFLSQEAIGEKFGGSVRRGLAQSEAGETTVCRNYDEMVEKILGE